MHLASLASLAQVAEKSAVGTAVGCVIGRLVLPAIWKDLKRAVRR